MCKNHNRSILKTTVTLTIFFLADVGIRLSLCFKLFLRNSGFSNRNFSEMDKIESLIPALQNKGKILKKQKDDEEEKRELLRQRRYNFSLSL